MSVIVKFNINLIFFFLKKTMTLRLATNGTNEKGIMPDIALKNEVSLSGVLANNYGYCNATPLGPYQGTRNTKIIIDVPQEMIDLKQSYLEFQIAGSAGNTAGIVCSFVPDIRSIISRMTILFGSKTILDVIGYGLLQNILNYTNDPQWYNFGGNVLVASDSSQTNRQAYFTSTNKVYACKLGFAEGIESLFQKIIPFNKVGSTMQIQIWLDDPQNVISTSIAPTGTVNPSYVVNQVEFHYVSYYPSPELNAMYDSKISNNNFITFTYRSFDYQLDTSSVQAGLTSVSKFLTYKYTNFLGLILAFQPQALPGTWTADNKMNYFFNPGVNVLRLKVGSQYYPQENYTSDSDVYGRFLLTFGISPEFPIQAAANWNYNGSTPASASYIATTPVMKYPDSIKSDERMEVCGLDTSIATSLQLDLGFSAAVPSGGLQLLMWCYYGVTISINKNGSVTLNT